MLNEDFAGIAARERMIIEADLWEEMARDLENPEVQRALFETPEQVARMQDEQARDHDKKAA